MTWRKLTYGTLVSALLAGGGTAIYYSFDRGTVHVLDPATLVECYLERAAAVGEWPFTNRQSSAGWGVGYTTNIDGATLWSFYDLTNAAGPTIPLFGSVNPRVVWQVINRLPSLASNYVASISSSGTPVMATHAGIISSLGIGDGVDKFTVAVDSNGNHVYGDNIGWVCSTVTLAEVWRYLHALTATLRRVEFETNFVYTSNLQHWDTNQVVYSTTDVWYVEVPPFPPYATDQPGPNGNEDIWVTNQFDLARMKWTSAVPLELVGGPGYGPYETAEIALPEDYNFGQTFTENDGTYLVTRVEYVNFPEYQSRGYRSRGTLSLDFPAMPSGVVAQVTPRWTTEASFLYYIGRPTDATNVVLIDIYPNASNFPGYVPGTSVVFLSDLATGVWQSISLDVQPTATNDLAGTLPTFLGGWFEIYLSNSVGTAWLNVGTTNVGYTAAYWTLRAKDPWHFIAWHFRY